MDFEDRQITIQTSDKQNINNFILNSIIETVRVQ